jgi:hypothetical protein
MTIILIAFMVLMMLGFSGVIPADMFITVYILFMLSVIGFIGASFLYPYMVVAGKEFLAISIRKGVNEVEYAFAKIKENEKGELLAEECPGAPDMLCIELESVPFLPTEVPFKGLAVKFPNKVTFDSLFDSDYVTPETGIGKIPIRTAYLAGVYIGDYMLARPTNVLPTLKEKVIKKLRKSRVKPERVPIALITWSKPWDVELRKRIKDSLKAAKIKPFDNYPNKVWIDEIGRLVIYDSEKEELKATIIKLEERLKRMEEVFHKKFSFAFELPQFRTAEEIKTEKMMKKFAIAGGAIAALLALLIILGLI